MRGTHILKSKKRKKKECMKRNKTTTQKNLRLLFPKYENCNKLTNFNNINCIPAGKTI